MRGDDRGQLNGCRGDQPDALTGVEVALSQRERSRDELVGQGVGEDLLAQVNQLTHRASVDERQGGLSGRCHVLEVLGTGEHELGLRPGEPGDLSGGEELAAREPRGEVEEAGTSHQSVVDIEERRAAAVEGHGVRTGRCGDVGSGC